MTKNKKHMDGTSRCRIQFGLDAGESGKTIARDVGMQPSTVMREIRKHTQVSFKGCYGRKNQCVKRATCRLANVCKDCTAKGVRCSVCSLRNCNNFCNQVEFIDCDKRALRTAQVCNGCPDMSSCHIRKFIYDAKAAQDEYRKILCESLYGEGVAGKLHVKKIDPKKVILKPKLVGIEMK